MARARAYATAEQFAEGCDEGDGGEEISGETVVAGGNASPVLHPAEHALDDVTTPIGDVVERIRPSAASIGGDDHLCAEALEPLTEMVGVVGFIRQQTARWRDVVEQRGGDGDVGDVARRQDEGDRFALSIGQSVDLAGAPAT